MGPLNFTENFRILNAGSAHSPQTSHGPALAVLNNELYAVYVGEGNKNLWFMRLSSGVGFNAWQGNQPVRVAGAGLQSSYRPALAVLDGLMHMVYQGVDGTHLFWAWFDGQQWAGNIQLPSPYQQPAGAGTYSLQQCQPSLCVDNAGDMHLAYHAYLNPLPPGGIQNQLLHGTYSPTSTTASANPSLSEWSAPDVITRDFSQPAVNSFGQTLSLLATSTLNSATSNALQYAAGAPGAWGGFSPLGPALSTDGGVFLVFNGLLYAIYRGQGHRNIWYVWMSNPPATLGNNQVKAPGSSVETSAPFSAAVFNNEVCIAYKGQASDNFWFTHGS